LLPHAQSAWIVMVTSSICILTGPPRIYSSLLVYLLYH
jgi:hypothetical protein